MGSPSTRNPRSMATTSTRGHRPRIDDDPRAQRSSGSEDNTISWNPAASATGYHLWVHTSCLAGLSIQRRPRRPVKFTGYASTTYDFFVEAFNQLGSADPHKTPEHSLTDQRRRHQPRPRAHRPRSLHHGCLRPGGPQRLRPGVSREPAVAELEDRARSLDGPRHEPGVGAGSRWVRWTSPGGK